MKLQLNHNKNFNQDITLASQCLQNSELEKAMAPILDAMIIDPSAPEPHNLLGVYYELKFDKDKARRHYRASYALEPTYTPACKNLEQICMVLDEKASRTYDLGSGLKICNYPSALSNNTDLCTYK